MPIRPFKPSDAPALAQVFYAAIHEIARLHYSAEQVKAWAPQVPPSDRFLARGMDVRTLLVATDESDDPLAYGDLEADGHIDHLFCRPDHAGSGLTASLYLELENVARRKGIKRLHVEASEPARRFFAKRGFAIVARNDFELDGVAMHNFLMEKQL
jgi:putative acetyltransferase